MVMKREFSNEIKRHEEPIWEHKSEQPTEFSGAKKKGEKKLYLGVRK